MSRTVGKHRIIAVVALLVAVFSSMLRNRANLSMTSKPGSFVNETATSHPTETLNLRQPGSLATQSSFLLPKTSTEFRPTTTVDRGCTSVSSQHPLLKVTSFPDYQNVSMFWRRIGDDEKLAVCDLSFHRGTSTHFPHVMQKLYACFSYWKEHTTRQPILLTSMPSEAATSKLNRNPFLNGFLHVMRAQLGVKVMCRDELDIWVNESQNDRGTGTTSRYTVQSFHISGGYVLSNVQNLSDLARADLQLPSTQVTRQNNQTISFCPMVKPRIGILNRRRNAGRSISNEEQVVRTISEMATISVSLAPVEYFEGRSFRDQVEFFNGVDILISPHGAQLTGIPFMTNKPCSQLLELFPKGYFIPSFFGSLAVNAQVGYSYLYLSDNNPEVEQAQDLRERVSVRSMNICPDLALIASSVQSLVQDWCHCKQQLFLQGGEGD